jgi:hypothetical protein
MRNLTIYIKSIKRLRIKWKNLYPKYKRVNFFYRKIQTVLNASILKITRINYHKYYLRIQTEKMINKDIEMKK